MDTILAEKHTTTGQSYVHQINRSLLHSSVHSAFRYYRGEPDGDFSKGAIVAADQNSINGYISQKSLLSKNNTNNFTYLKPVASIKCSYRGESDAAFTPSPPVNTSHNNNIQNSLGYQKIFHDHSSTSDISQSDWDISGHSTVLRKSIYGNRKSILSKSSAPHYFTEKDDNANFQNTKPLNINSILGEFNKSLVIAENVQKTTDDIYQLRRPNGDGKSKEDI